ncbi:MAG: hypothetical protein ACREI2_01565, partial [Nitrospiraceae bacterium]
EYSGQTSIAGLAPRMPGSQEIGRSHENAVERTLQRWGILFRRQEPFVTTQGIKFKVDFWLSRTDSRPAIVIECKNFDVAAKQSSRPRKLQEALYQLLLVRRHSLQTRASRIILVTGQTEFLERDVDLMAAELGPDFHVVPFKDLERNRNLFGMEC